MPHLVLVLVLIISISKQVSTSICNFVNNNYQHDSRVFYAFVSNKLFAQLLDISPKK